MIKSILFKAFKLARGTALVVGVAVMLALMFGVATTAFAHKGEKGFFHLGHRNVSEAVSTLVKKGAGPALSLKVGSGQPPLAVNSQKKVANLNADRLDNLDSSAFVKAGQKAADSDKLDGVDSTGFLRSGGKAANSEQLDGIDSSGFYRSGSKVADSDKLDGKNSTDFYAAGSKVADSTHADQADNATNASNAANAANADKLDRLDSSAFAGTGMSHYAGSTSSLEGCSEKVLLSSEISPSRPALVYASGVSVYEPSGGAQGGVLQLELRDATNTTTLASGGNMYANGGGNAVPLSAQGVLMSGSDVYTPSAPFEVTPGNRYVLRLVGSATDGCSGSTGNYGSMGYVSLSYLLIGK